MALTGEGADFYRSIGVKPVITASGSTTARGGSKLRTEVMDAMNAAATTMVDMDELNRQAGKILAEYTGAEAGFVSSGSAGGLVMQAAAVVAGSDPAKMARLPDTTGMKNDKNPLPHQSEPYLTPIIQNVPTFRPICGS